jgi:hypothetical protein
VAEAEGVEAVAQACEPARLESQPFAHGITLELSILASEPAIRRAGVGIAAAFQRALSGRTKIWPG